MQRHRRVMQGMVRLLMRLALLFACSTPALAQVPATLVADQVSLDGDQRITATGNVEVLYQGDRLRAPRIVYDQAEDRILIDGPLVLTASDGTVLTGSQGDLDADLLNGIVLGARIVLEEQMQIAGAEAFRVAGRYNQLGRAVASSCRICGDGPPIWQVRARRVVHDAEEKQIYFYDARFEVVGVPIAYLPRLRFPDPSLRRATGFLTPSYRVSDLFGLGIKVPYFIVIDDQQDLLVTPYLAPKTRTVELRYRRAFRNGTLTLRGAASSDDIRPGRLRYYMRADLNLSLPRDFQLAVSLMDVSDGAYGSEYGYPIGSDLRSNVTLSRTRRTSYFAASGTYYETRSVTPSLAFNTNPTGQLSARYDRRFQPYSLGGQARFGVEISGLSRPANTITPAILAACGTSVTVDCTARDTLQTHAELTWQRNWTLAGGLRAGLSMDSSADYVLTQDDPAFSSSLTQVAPAVGARLSWPLKRQNRGGSQVLEPVLQVAYAQVIGDTLPNDDSRLSELDFGNFLELSRFSGSDRREIGASAAVGLSWSYFAQGGWSAHLAGGRIFRDRAVAGFTNASGLAGTASDYVLAAGLSYGALSVQSRALVAPDLAVTRAETRAALAVNRVSVSGTHFFSLADLAEGRATEVHEVALSGGITLSRHWTTNLATRFDLVSDRRDDTVVGLTYQNECIRVGLSWTQRYISSTSATQETAYTLSIGLNGLGNDARQFRRSCTG